VCAATWASAFSPSTAALRVTVAKRGLERDVIVLGLFGLSGVGRGALALTVIVIAFGLVAAH
jgi:hypothetical protein